MDRRTAIADAAIEILASEGSRGLTHRAVDRHLDLPTGSVSYYFRDRSRLVGAAAQRLVELDRSDIENTHPDTDGLCDLLNKWLEPENRQRLIARFELFMSSTRSAAAGPLATARTSIVENLTGAMRHSNPHADTRDAIGIVALIEGLLLDAMMGSQLNEDDRRTLIAGALNPHKR